MAIGYLSARKTIQAMITTKAINVSVSGQHIVFIIFFLFNSFRFIPAAYDLPSADSI